MSVVLFVYIPNMLFIVEDIVWRSFDGVAEILRKSFDGLAVILRKSFDGVVAFARIVLRISLGVVG